MMQRESSVTDSPLLPHHQIVKQRSGLADIESVGRSQHSESVFNFDSPNSPHFDSRMAAALPGREDRTARPVSSYAALPGSFGATDNSFVYGENNSSKVIQVFVEPPNKKLCCPLCKNVFKEPVITTCGHTFCKDCISVDSQDTCPIDKKQTRYIVDNIALSEQIGELYVHCRYGCKEGSDGTFIVDDLGCPTTIRLSERYSHEESCEFALITCPNNCDGPPCRRKDLQQHLESCTTAACPYKKYGCDFTSKDSRIEEHKQSCAYAKQREADRDAEIEILLKENKSAREDLDFLLASLKGLSQRCNTLEVEKDTLIEHVSKLSSLMDSMSKELHETRNQQLILMDEVNGIKSQEGNQYDGRYDLEPVVIKCKGTCVGHDGPVWCLAVDNDYLFSGSSDNHVKVWDTSANYKCVKTLGGHSGIVLSLAVYGGRLYSGSQDTKILVWNVNSGFELEDTLDAHDNPVCTLAASKGLLFSGSLKTVKVWESTSGKHKMVKEITGFNHWVRALYATDRELYCGSYQTIEIYNLDTWALTTTLKTFGGSVYSICVTDKHILCGTYEKVIHVWELSSMEQVTTLQGHQGTVYALSWMNSPGGMMVFSASYDRTIRVWSMSNMLCKQTLIRHTGSVACLAVSKGRLFSGGIDSMVKVWQ